MIMNMKPQTASEIATGIINTFEASGSPFTVIPNFICRFCSMKIGLLIGSNRYPKCGNPIK